VPFEKYAIMVYLAVMVNQHLAIVNVRLQSGRFKERFHKRVSFAGNGRKPGEDGDRKRFST